MMTPRTRATLQVGDTGSFSKTITEKDVFEFADATGDFNPLHIDEEYAKRTVLPVTSYELQVTDYEIVGVTITYSAPSRLFL